MMSDADITAADTVPQREVLVITRLTQLADVLEQHQLTGAPFRRCSCGWRASSIAVPDYRRQHCLHLAGVLAG